MWHDTSFTKRLGIRYPIVQGAFGGGISTPRLTAAVSNAGGLGSYGAQVLSATRIKEVTAEIRTLTTSPFAVNLWVSTQDPGATSITRDDYEAALRPLAPFFNELSLEPPPLPTGPWPTFEEQVPGILDARPPAFSFIFGVPPADIFKACRDRNIITIGTATSVDEAVALASAGADIIVASGFEAGGHRASFLRTSEASLMGTFALIPQVADAVNVPVVAAGGIADGRGVAAALTLGAAGAQLGTAFLACEESNATPAHKDALRSDATKYTMLTRAFTGRLARGLTNTLGETLHNARGPFLPYPVQRELLRSLQVEAAKQGRTDLLTMWSGQAAPLIKHRHAAELVASLVKETEAVLRPRASTAESATR